MLAAIAIAVLLLVGYWTLKLEGEIERFERMCERQPIERVSGWRESPAFCRTKEIEE